MLRGSSYFISVVFHPLLLPTYLLLFILWAQPYFFAGLNPGDKAKFFLSIFINTFVFPVIVVGLMKKLKFIESFQLKTNQERVIPLVAVSIFYFWCFMVVKKVGVGNFITATMLGASISVFASFFFNLFFKISVHAVGAGNFLGVAFLLVPLVNFNLEIPLMIIIILAGVVGTSRLYLDAHKPGDIFFGYFVGIAAQLIAFQFF